MTSERDQGSNDKVGDALAALVSACHDIIARELLPTATHIKFVTTLANLESAQRCARSAGTRTTEELHSLRNVKHPSNSGTSGLPHSAGSSTTTPLHEDMDAARWAREFMDVQGRNPTLAQDEGWMIGWFANAIMCGFDEASRRATRSASVALGEPCSTCGQDVWRKP